MEKVGLGRGKVREHTYTEEIYNVADGGGGIKGRVAMIIGCMIMMVDGLDGEEGKEASQYSLTVCDSGWVMGFTQS
jgi:hypothetical protein